MTVDKIPVNVSIVNNNATIVVVIRGGIGRVQGIRVVTNTIVTKLGTGIKLAAGIRTTSMMRARI